MPWNPAAQNLPRHVGNFTNNGTVQQSLKHHLIAGIKTGYFSRAQRQMVIL